MIKNLGNILIAKEILLLHHSYIIKETKNPSIKLEFKKIKRNKKRQYKKNLKKYIQIE